MPATPAPLGLGLLCHNICCVIQSMHEFGVTPDFGATVSAQGA